MLSLVHLNETMLSWYKEPHTIGSAADQTAAWKKWQGTATRKGFENTLGHLIHIAQVGASSTKRIKAMTNEYISHQRLHKHLLRHIPILLDKECLSQQKNGGASDTQLLKFHMKWNSQKLQHVVNEENLGTIITSQGLKVSLTAQWSILAESSCNGFPEVMLCKIILVWFWFQMSERITALKERSFRFCKTFTHDIAQTDCSPQ